MSQPIAGQIDGVACATSLRCRTSARVTLRWRSSEPSALRSRPKASSGERVAAATMALVSALAAAPPLAWLRTRAGSVDRAVRVAGSSCPTSLSAPIASCSCGDLSGQLAGRGAEAGVLLAQHAGGGAQMIELGRRAPARAQADQDRQREQTDHGGQGRPEAQVEPRTTPVVRSATRME